MCKSVLINRLSSVGVKKASIRITDEKHQVVNVHDNPKMESTKELVHDQLKHEKTTSKDSDQKEISLEVQSSTKVENTSLDIPMEPEMNRADLQIIQKDKEMVNVESKLEIEGTDNLIMPSIETQPQKLKIKPLVIIPYLYSMSGILSYKKLKALKIEVCR